MLKISAWKWSQETQGYTIPCKNYQSETTETNFKTMKKRYSDQGGRFLYCLSGEFLLDSFISDQVSLF